MLHGLGTSNIFLRAGPTNGDEAKPSIAIDDDFNKKLYELLRRDD